MNWRPVERRPQGLSRRLGEVGGTGASARPTPVGRLSGRPNLLAASFRRIRALFFRYLVLHKRNVLRVFDVFFWPVMDLLIWGYLTLYIRDVIQGEAAQLGFFLIGAMISWDIHYRGQQAVTMSLMEEIWTRNITNLLITPVRLWEWIAASFLYGALKVAFVTTILGTISWALYSFKIIELGWVFLPLAANLLFFGWAIGLFTAGILMRYGYAAEALIWGIPFLIQPFSCVFYPVTVLPGWAQAIARVIPTSYIFDALRTVLSGGQVSMGQWIPIVGLNLFYFAVGIGFFLYMFERSRSTGHLSRLCQD